MKLAPIYRTSALELGVFLLVLWLLACGVSTNAERPAPSYTPDTPRYEEDHIMAKVWGYFFGDGFKMDEYWARPMFPVEKWSGSYQGNGIWLVRVYGIDDAYVGTWSVVERGGIIEPWDEPAKAATASREFVRPPAVPPFVPQWSWLRNEYMVQAVQLHIASLSPEEVLEDPEIKEIRELIRSYYPLEWDIKYNSTTWELTTIFNEIVVDAYIDPESGTIRVFASPVWR